MEEGKDGRGHSYIEIPWSADEALRVTLVPQAWSGSRGLRLQARDAANKVRPGPEIPEEIVGDVLKAMVDLLRRPSSG